MGEQEGSKAPVYLGVVMMIFSLMPTVGGIWLLTRGDNAYFLIIGLGVLASGIFLVLRKKTGMFLYLATFAVVLIWSVVEERANIGKLLPRVLVPAILVLCVLSPRIRKNLN